MISAKRKIIKIASSYNLSCANHEIWQMSKNIEFCDFCNVKIYKMGLSKTQTLQQLSNSNQTGFIGFSLMFSRLKIKLNKIVSQLGRRIKVLLLSKDTARYIFLNNNFVSQSSLYGSTQFSQIWDSRIKIGLNHWNKNSLIILN